jgi:hypothetical protein
MSTLPTDRILSDPLALHYELKARGWGFAKVARSVTTTEQAITASIVRAVIYGVSAKHFDPIMAEVRRILEQEPVRRARSALTQGG